MNDDLPININQHCVRFDVCSPYDAAYVAAAMNSPFVKRQVDRLAIGGTRDALDYPSVRALLIPILSEPVMKKVSRQVRLLNKARRMSQQLVVAARCITEALIDGEISQPELIEIQQAIGQGDNKADRKLLERLTVTGLDRANSPKVFQDLDALFQILVDSDSAEQKETV
jgi:hypothetical protein